LSSRFDAAPAHAAATKLGIRLISPDRPGMGQSTYQPDRRLVDWVDDVVALTGALDIDRFAVMGWSCGGPYAAVCGARLQDRVTRVALLSSAIPLDLFGTTRGLSFDDRVLLLLVRRAPGLAATLMRVMIADATEGRLYREVIRSIPPVDRAVIKAMGPPAEAVAFLKESSGIPGASISATSRCRWTSGRAPRTGPDPRRTVTSSCVTCPMPGSSSSPTRGTSPSWPIAQNRSWAGWSRRSRAARSRAAGS
jgi:pimeloyl-ACP methyl ester carboxylesterase